MSNELIKQVGRQYRSRFKFAEEAREAVIKAAEISSLLPESITNANWYRFFKRYDGSWHLETSILTEGEADNLIKACKIFGIQGIISEYISAVNRWHYSAKFNLGGNEIYLMIDGGSPPAGCRLEEHREWKEVVTYEVICEKEEALST